MFSHNRARPFHQEYARYDNMESIVPYLFSVLLSRKEKPIEGVVEIRGQVIWIVSFMIFTTHRIMLKEISSLIRVCTLQMILKDFSTHPIRLTRLIVIEDLEMRVVL